MTTITTPLTEAELYEQGRAARAVTSRSSQGEYAPAPDRDPLGILRAQHTSRVPWLVELRVERMSADAFAFYRGTAAIQASDLSAAPTSGAEVIICGDAHVSNFGVYRSPENTMVFDINDFDEASAGPWEWDVKRLLTSVVLAGRSLTLAANDLRSIVHATAQRYRDSLRTTLSRPLWERYFTPTGVISREKLHPDFERMVKRTLKESVKRTGTRVASRLLEDDGTGSLRFIQQPPVLTRPDPEIHALVDDVFEAYRATLPPNLALMLSRYRVLDTARRVVGVGSVGTRCFIIALQGPTGEVGILQLKEAGASVVQEFGGIEPAVGYLDPARAAQQNGYRVVSCQRILQAVSDPFLGYLNVASHHFYARMFRNRNASFEIAEMNLNQFTYYVQACAVALARAHARSPKASCASGYMGDGDAFLRAATEWAHSYADQAEADHALFVQAAQEGYFA